MVEDAVWIRGMIAKVMCTRTFITFRHWDLMIGSVTVMFVRAASPITIHNDQDRLLSPEKPDANHALNEMSVGQKKKTQMTRKGKLSTTFSGKEERPFSLLRSLLLDLSKNCS